MTISMTGFASRQGAFERYSWTWDLRSVNGRSLDLRLRMPDWIEGLEPLVRSRLQKALSRGSVQVSLRVTATQDSASGSLSEEALQAALDMLTTTEAAAKGKGLELRPSSAAEVLGLRGVLDGPLRDTDTTALRKALEADLDPLIADLQAMRRREGAALRETLLGQLATVEDLHAKASDAVASRAETAAQNLRTQVERVLEQTDTIDEGRLAQEIAILAVKADVTEELDRLVAHIEAARDLLDSDAPQGRKLDFLIQEFNREANTLCSKAGSHPLTAVGLDLKATIDQMREQVQNVE